MSLVATWCKCNDGCWYEEPVWWDEHWFLCLDDDDPPELVVERGTEVPVLPWFEAQGEFRRSGSRMFVLPSGPRGRVFRPADKVFGRLINVPPPPRTFDSKSGKRPGYMGCYYDLTCEGCEMPICDRCGKETLSTKMSMFNEDVICPECIVKEKEHPDYEKAH